MNRFFYIPEAASAQAAAIDQLVDIMHIIMAVLFVGWGAFFVYILIRFRASRNPSADHDGVKSHASTYLEVAVAAVEAVLLIGFSIPIWGARVNDVPGPDESVTVRVVGEQFVWNMHYPGADGKFGRSDVGLINLETNPLGLDPDDPDGADDITTINQLHVPVNHKVVIQLSTKDVIHSLNLPHMRVKQDAVPGMTIPTWFEPTVTTDEMRERTGNDEFQYEIACAQLCGLGHYRMGGFLTVHTQEAYEAWLVDNAPSEEGGDDFWE